jgi:hypothetical protein
MGADMKTIKFKSDLWGGTVNLTDPLTLEQEAAFEQAAHEAKKAKEKYGDEIISTFVLVWLPTVLLCVDKWNLKDFPERPTMETFPTRPIKELAMLISQLVKEITALYVESIDIPNASGANPTPMPQETPPSPEN